MLTDEQSFTTKSYAYHRFSSDSVRDLAWLLLSPSVFDGPLGPFPAFQINTNADTLLTWLEAQDHIQSGCSNIPSRENFRRLGLYCEALLHYFIKNCATNNIADIKLLAHNLQIFNQGNTLGECDLLLESDASNVFHVELAVKFYLQRKSGDASWNNWIGPNSIDRLDLKCSRLVDHQLSLPEKFPEAFTDAMKKTPFGKAAEISETYRKNIQSSHVFKGMNFIHFDTLEDIIRPTFASDRSLVGTWGRLSELKESCSRIESIFHKNKTYLVDKIAWLTGDRKALRKTINESLNDVEALFDSANERGYPAPGAMLFIETDETETRLKQSEQTNLKRAETPRELKSKKAPFRRPIENRIIVVEDDWPAKQ